MSKKKARIGICRLCGEKRELTFEHVPPRVAFNKTTRYVSVPLLDYAKADDPLNFKPKGKVSQGGTGRYALCGSCNNFLGSNYVNAYKNWVYAGREVLNKGNYQYLRYDANNQEPLKILKQVISMFLSINAEWYLEDFPELSNFVKDPNSNDLPDRYRVFAYLNNEGNIRNFHHSVFYSPSLGGAVNCSEISFPPYGYVLTIDFNKDINILSNITGFKNYSINDKVCLNMEMFNLPTHLQFPFDYRSKEKIAKDIKEENEIMKNNNEK